MKKLMLNYNPQWHDIQPGVKLHIAPVTRYDINRMKEEAAGNKQKLDELMADRILLGWEGLVSEDNNNLPVTLENKLAVFGNPFLFQFIDSKVSGLQTIEENS